MKRSLVAGISTVGSSGRSGREADLVTADGSSTQRRGASGLVHTVHNRLVDPECAIAVCRSGYWRRWRKKCARRYVGHQAHRVGHLMGRRWNGGCCRRRSQDVAL